MDSPDVPSHGDEASAKGFRSALNSNPICVVIRKTSAAGTWRNSVCAACWAARFCDSAMMVVFGCVLQ